MGKESFLNNLVKVFPLPALTLALGTGAACSWPTDGGSRHGDWPEIAQERQQGTLWLLGTGKSKEQSWRHPWLPLPLYSVFTAP